MLRLSGNDGRDGAEDLWTLGVEHVLVICGCGDGTSWGFWISGTKPVRVREITTRYRHSLRGAPAHGSCIPSLHAVRDGHGTDHDSPRGHCVGSCQDGQSLELSLLGRDNVSCQN